MERAEATLSDEKAARAEALPELVVWREMGWIFRDGGCVAIERRGDETRLRTLGDCRSGSLASPTTAPRRNPSRSTTSRSR